jgi:hypothetical protein
MGLGRLDTASARVRRAPVVRVRGTARLDRSLTLATQAPPDPVVVTTAGHPAPVPLTVTAPHPAASNQVTFPYPRPLPRTHHPAPVARRPTSSSVSSCRAGRHRGTACATSRDRTSRHLRLTTHRRRPRRGPKARLRPVVGPRNATLRSVDASRFPAARQVVSPTGNNRPATKLLSIWDGSGRGALLPIPAASYVTGGCDQEGVGRTKAVGSRQLQRST